MAEDAVELVVQYGISNDAITLSPSLQRGDEELLLQELRITIDRD
jgi:hypothetical protein